MAMPAAGATIGTPPSIIARVDPQTEAMEEDPFEDRISDTTRMVYGNTSLEGIMAKRALSAKAPCPISLLPGEPILLTSPVLKGGKKKWCMNLFLVRSISIVSIHCSRPGAARVRMERA